MTTTCADCGRNYESEDWDGQVPCPSDDCPSHCLAMDPETLDSIYNPDGDGEHPQYGREQWRNAVKNEGTISGYWVWVSHMLRLEAYGDKPMTLDARDVNAERIQKEDYINDDRDMLRAEIVALKGTIADLEAKERTETTIAWGAFYFGGKLHGQLYSHAHTEAQIDSYIADVHRSNDSITLRKKPLFTTSDLNNT